MNEILDTHETDKESIRITEVTGFRILYMLEIIMISLSTLVIGYYALIYPSNYDWIPLLSNLEMGFVFLGVLLVGFVVKLSIIFRTNKKMNIEKTLSISKFSSLIISLPSLFILNVVLGLALTLLLSGTITTSVLGIFTFYGFGLGCLLAYEISKLLGLQRWQLTQNLSNQEIVISDKM